MITLYAAWKIDAVGAHAALAEISAIKVVAPNVMQQVVDAAIQIHGAAGVSYDTPLAMLYGHARTLRLADGPDEVHRHLIARTVVACATRAGGEPTMAGKRDLRQALLEAACEMFAAQGYGRTSTAAIVRRSRSSNGNLFHYFGNKDGLLRAAAAHELAQRRAYIDPVLAACAAGAERLGVFAFLNALFTGAGKETNSSCDKVPGSFT